MTLLASIHRSGRRSRPERRDCSHRVSRWLVIDDEPTLRMLIVEVPEEAGYVVMEAEDGAAGLKIIQSDTLIDLLRGDGDI